MCGIVVIFGNEIDISSTLLTHRGPNEYRSKILKKCRMDFYRLAINDLTSMGMKLGDRASHFSVCTYVYC